MNGDCYFARECEALGVPLIVTPIESFKEQGLKDGENCYYVPFNMENIDINKIANNIPSYDGYLLDDNWEEILEKGKSTYKEEMKMRYLVEATNKYEKTSNFDLELSKQRGVKKYIPKQGEQWEVDFERKEKLVELGYVEVVEEIKEVETAVKEVKKEKAVKKVTKKNK